MVCRTFCTFAEQIFVEHGVEFLFGRAIFFAEVFGVAQLAEYLQGSPFGATAVLAARRRRQVVCIAGFSQSLE